jgi:GNAT superfamily N-acetyltransferase
MNEKIFNQLEPLSTIERLNLIDFLYEHLDEYGDTKEAIGLAIDYAHITNPMAGGFVLQLSEGDEITGAVVMNKTGMRSYIPENILVYIAVHRNYRGKGLGKKMMNKIMQLTKGDIALHVEKDNPAKLLYEKVGFESPYIEMRYYEAKH